MVSFVGYVNALVVENCLLQELPDAVFNQDIVYQEDQQKISLVAAEKDSDSRQRAQYLQDNEALEGVLATLERHRDN
jgi:hypothetical protein